MARRPWLPPKPYPLILNVQGDFYMCWNHGGVLKGIEKMSDYVLSNDISIINVEDFVPDDGRPCKIGTLTFERT